RAVGLVQRHIRAQQDGPQRRVGRTGTERALGHRHQLYQPVERWQDPLESEQRGEIGWLGPERREVDTRRLLELTGTLKLDALPPGGYGGGGRPRAGPPWGRWGGGRCRPWPSG